MPSLHELLEQKQQLDQQIAYMQGEKRAEAIASVRQIMAEYGLTVGDISSKMPRQNRITSKNKVAAKYRNAETGETWSGRGLRPKWLKTALESGKTLEDFAVSQAAD